MNLQKIVGLTVVGIVLVLGFSIFGMYVSYNNQAVALVKKGDAQKGNVEAVYDNMWKILSQKAQVTDQYKDTFKEIYPKLIEGRYSKGDGTLMKWIQESNPNFDISLYKDLMKSIEIERDNFTAQQKIMLDIKREHETLCNSIPAKWFISDANAKPIEYIVISSTKSKEVVKTGVDDDVDLFKK